MNISPDDLFDMDDLRYQFLLITHETFEDEKSTRNITKLLNVLEGYRLVITGMYNDDTDKETLTNAMVTSLSSIISEIFVCFGEKYKQGKLDKLIEVHKENVKARKGMFEKLNPEQFKKYIHDW